MDHRLDRLQIGGERLREALGRGGQGHVEAHRRVRRAFRLDSRPAPCLCVTMRELLRTNDPTIIAFVTALLGGEGIECFILDVNTSILEGSIGILPRRIMVREGDLEEARIVVTDNGIEHS